MDQAFALQQQRMRSLSDCRDNIVYEYTYDTPIRSACPEQALKLAREAVTWRQGPEGKKLSDGEARRALVAGEVTDAPLADFAKSFPKAFELITEKERGPEHFAVLVRMARFAKTAEEHRVPEAEATAQVNTMLQTHCTRGPAPKQETTAA
jgi:hypothetical protein